MDVYHRNLTEGVELIVLPARKFKTGMLSVTLVTPLKENTATANALVMEVLNRGSRLHPDIESLSAATDDLYGMSLSTIVRQKGECQCVGLLSSFLDDRFVPDGSCVLEPAAMLMAEVLLDPLTENGAFREDYVESEGENLADLIRSQINDKRSWSVHRVTELMCEGEAYAVNKYGLAHEADSISAQTLWDCYQALLKEAGIIFYYSGSAPAEQVEMAIRTAFGPILTPRTFGYACDVVAAPKREVRSHTDHLDVTQGKLAIGFRTGGIVLGDPLYPALMVCNAIYGGTATSRLFLNVREKLSLCYYAGSMMDKLKGLMVVSSGVEFANFAVARNEILAQLKAIQDGEFTDEELHVGRRALVSGLRTMSDSHGRMEDFLLTHAVAGNPLTPEDLIAAVETVTREQVMDVAGRLTLDTVYYLAGEED